MDNMYRKVRSLCTPAMIFLVISTIQFIFKVVMISKNGTYPFCFHDEKCDTYLTYTTLGINLIFNIVAVIILNVICSYGYNVVAWVLFAGLMIFRHLESASIDVSF